LKAGKSSISSCLNAAICWSMRLCTSQNTSSATSVGGSHQRQHRRIWSR
jgi:hypothetical protein